MNDILFEGADEIEAMARDEAAVKLFEQMEDGPQVIGQAQTS